MSTSREGAAPISVAIMTRVIGKLTEVVGSTLTTVKRAIKYSTVADAINLNAS